jgi:hypothetical protein
MLTKSLQFDDDVLQVLNVMTVTNDDGQFKGVLNGQLDRGLYTRTNKALEALGGKWSRGARAHIFTRDPRKQLAGLLDTGTTTIERDGFFETPVSVIQRMIEIIPCLDTTGHILEPSAGNGAIVKALLNQRILSRRIWCVEKNPDRALKLRDYVGDVFCCDFLIWNSPMEFDRIYMNPPFEEEQDIRHVKHAYSMLRYDGAMISVMSEHAFFADDNKAFMFRTWLDAVGGYSEKLPQDSFKESGTGVKTRLVVIRKAAYIENHFAVKG